VREGDAKEGRYIGRKDDEGRMKGEVKEGRKEGAVKEKRKE
jgi:hypothetical protein